MSITYISHFKYLSTLTLSVLDNITAKKKKTKHCFNIFWCCIDYYTKRSVVLFHTEAEFFQTRQHRGQPRKKKVLRSVLEKTKTTRIDASLPVSQCCGGLEM